MGKVMLPGRRKRSSSLRNGGGVTAVNGSGGGGGGGMGGGRGRGRGRGGARATSTPKRPMAAGIKTTRTSSTSTTVLTPGKTPIAQAPSLRGLVNKLAASRKKPEPKSASSTSTPSLGLAAIRTLRAAAALPPRPARRGPHADPPPLRRRSEASAAEDRRDLLDLQRTYCHLVSKYSAEGGGCLGRSPRGVQAMFEFYFGNNEVILRLKRRGFLRDGGGEGGDKPFGHSPCGRCPPPPPSVWPFSDSRVWKMGAPAAEALAAPADEGEAAAWDPNVSPFHLARNYTGKWEFLDGNDEEEKEEEEEVVEVEPKKTDSDGNNNDLLSPQPETGDTLVLDPDEALMAELEAEFGLEAPTTTSSAEESSVVVLEERINVEKASKQQQQEEPKKKKRTTITWNLATF